MIRQRDDSFDQTCGLGIAGGVTEAVDKIPMKWSKSKQRLVTMGDLQDAVTQKLAKDLRELALSPSIFESSESFEKWTKVAQLNLARVLM